jgi:catechol 1,2-dioxygenase
MYKKNYTSKPAKISRTEFIVKGGVLAGATVLLPTLALGQDCNLTSDDILGPYFIEGAPIRTVIAHADEPGQRLFVSGRILQNDCETPISGAMLEIWHANDAGCYSINLDCNTGNPGEDEYNLRGKMFSNGNGQYAFETILPGNYASRPLHIHIKITTPDGEVLVSQIYFDNDPLCESDPWCQDAEERILSLNEDSSGLNGQLDIVMNSTLSGIIPGDVNLDGAVNVQDIVLAVGIIMGSVSANDFQMYAADLNQDTEIDILDIVLLVSQILAGRRSFQPLQGGHIKIENDSVSIFTDGEVAGIQLFTKGDFRIKNINLPSNWKLHHENNIILFYNIDGGKGISGKLFEFDGNLEIVSNIITDWDAQRLSADVNPNPEEFHLSDPYPNPFNPTVNINFIQQKTSTVNIAVFDVKGRELAVLFNGLILKGKTSFTWNAAIYPTGIYFIKARSGNQVQVKKVQLLK